MKIPERYLKSLDTYIKLPVLWDSLLMAASIIINELFLRYSNFRLIIDDGPLGNLLNELVSSSMSIGGFVIAALTIILTLKDNLKAKENSYPITALEILFNSKHYKRVVRVFYWASIVCLFTFFYFSLLEVVFSSFSNLKLLMYLIVYGLVLTALAVGRCLLILLFIIEIQLKGKEFESRQK